MPEKPTLPPSSELPSDQWILVRYAVMSGDRDELMRLGAIDWKNIRNSDADHQDPLDGILMVACWPTSNEVNIRACAVKLLKIALDEGCKEPFEIWTEGEQPRFVEPILSIVESKFTEAMALFLESGFDPEQVYGVDGLNAIELANEEDSPAIESLLRASVAKKTAIAAVAEIEAGKNAEKIASLELRG